MTALYGLCEEWEAAAARLRGRGLHSAADVSEGHARQLREFLTKWENEPLTLDVAAAEGGYSTSRLGQLVNTGKIPNAGSMGRPRILRKHVPRRPGFGIDAPLLSVADGGVVDLALSAQVEG